MWKMWHKDKYQCACDRVILTDLETHKGWFFNIVNIFSIIIYTA